MALQLLALEMLENEENVQAALAVPALPESAPVVDAIVAVSAPESSPVASPVDEPSGLLADVPDDPDCPAGIGQFGNGEGSRWMTHRNHC
jgi:hypothetical protein